MGTPIKVLLIAAAIFGALVIAFTIGQQGEEGALGFLDAFKDSTAEPTQRAACKNAFEAACTQGAVWDGNITYNGEEVDCEQYGYGEFKSC